MDYVILNEGKPTREVNRQDSKKNSIPQKEFYAYDPQWRMDEVVLRGTVRDSIEDVIAFCINRETIIKKWNFASFLKGNGTICINLYGEPGTGKSITAEAMVGAMGLKAIKVSLSEILGNLQGQTEQNLTALFDFATKNNHVIIFDDADSMLTKRSVGSPNSESSNISKDHLLNLLDKYSVIIIFTTNFMESYDEAFKSRMLFNVNVPLPNEAERESIWKFHLSEEVPKEISYKELAAMSEGLSGRNIRQVTLTMGIRLSVGKLSTITRESIQSEVDKILAANSQSKGVKVKEEDLPESVKKGIK